MVNILVISGSLRSQSSNAAILQAMGELAPDSIHISIYHGIGYL